MTMQLKGKLYRTLVRPALLYGADIWSTTRSQTHTLDEMTMLRMMSESRCKIQSETSM